MPNIRRLAPAAWAGIIAIVLNACGGGGSSTSTPMASQPPPGPTPGVALLAGSIGGQADIDATGTSARFMFPHALAADARGDLIVVDHGYAGVTVKAITPSGTVSSIGNRWGQWVALAGDGAYWTTGYEIHRISGNSDQLVPFAEAPPDGPFPVIAADNDGNAYIADPERCVVWKVTAALVKSVYAGSEGDCRSVDGAPSQARLGTILAIATDRHGAVYVSQYTGDPMTRQPLTYAATLRKIAADGTVSTVAGGVGADPLDGPAADARFVTPRRIAADGLGNVYVADVAGIRRVDASHNVTTLQLAGEHGAFDTNAYATTAPGAPYPSDVAADEQGNLYLSNSNSATITVVRPGSTQAVFFAGLPPDGTRRDGPAATARFESVAFAALDNNGDVLVPSFTSSGLAVRRVARDGTTTTESYPNTAGVSELDHRPLIGYAFDPSVRAHYLNFGTVCISDSVCDVGGNVIWRVAADGTLAQLAATPNRWIGPALDAQGNLYVSDSVNGLEKITPQGAVSSVAPQLHGALGVDGAGNVYVLDADQALRKVDRQGQMSVVSPAVAPASQQRSADQLAVDTNGNVYVPLGAASAGALEYVGNTGGPGMVRKVAPDGTVTTIAGQMDKSGIVLGALPGRIYAPRSILWTPDGLVVGSGWALLKIVQ